MVYFDSDPERGLVFTDVEFALAEDYRVRPDLLVLLHSKSAKLDLTKVPVPGAPDIAVEVISPTERSSDTQQKLLSYLNHGTQEVWQVYPKSKSTMVFTGVGTSRTITAAEILATLTLPGFTLEIAKLFL